jgi:HD-like signal output (HDOD) protein
MTTIPAAVQRVGLKGLRNVVLVAVAVNRMSLRDSAQRARLWRHSVKAACWSRQLARRSGACPPDEAFLGGLIHDLGTAVILSTQPAKADVALRLEREGRSRVEAEHWVFGQTHADLGALLCEIWSFAPDLVCAVALHHASIPDLRCHPSRTPLVDAVHAGCRLGMEAFDKAEARENAERFAALPEDFRAHHGLAPDLLEGLGDLQAEMDELLSWMK